MREYIKGHTDNSTISQNLQTSGSNSEKFRVDTDPSGKTSIIHQGYNRHERRADRALQIKYFRKVVRDMATKAKRAEARSKLQKNPPTDDSTISFEDAVSSTLAPQAPDTVPDED